MSTKVTRTKSEPTEELKTPGYQIVGLEVSNVMRVQIAKIIPPKGRVIQVSGRNGQGKTSLLRAIDFALTGTSTLPSEPIRKGAQTATITVDLGDFKIKRYFTRVDPTKSEKGNTLFSKLTIEGKNNEQFKSPQTLLDSFMGAFTFDPLAFQRLGDKPAKQVEALRKVVQFSEDIDALEAEMKTVYDERRIKGRELESAKARFAATEAPIDGLPEATIDTAALSHELSQAYKHNEQAAAKKRERDALTLQASQKVSEAVRLREEARQLLYRATELDGYKASVDVEKNATEEGEAQALNKKAEHIKVAEHVDTAELTNKLNDAQGTNAAILRRTVRQDLDREVQTIAGAFNELETKYEGLKSRRENAIATAKMPIEGLSVNEAATEVLFNGLPFGQASTAEQIKASAAIAIATSPKLRVMRIMDGSLLDDDSMQLLEQMASENDYQIWVERVAGRGGVGIVMEDGKASGEGVQPIEKF